MQYSTFVEDQGITFCFLLFHDISESPRKMHHPHPVVGFLSLGSSFQSTSQ